MTVQNPTCSRKWIRLVSESMTSVDQWSLDTCEMSGIYQNTVCSASISNVIMWII